MYGGRREVHIPRRRGRTQTTRRRESEFPRRLPCLVPLLCVITHRVLLRSEVEGQDPLMTASKKN